MRKIVSKRLYETHSSTLEQRLTNLARTVPVLRRYTNSSKSELSDNKRKFDIDRQTAREIGYYRPGSGVGRGAWFQLPTCSFSAPWKLFIIRSCRIGGVKSL
jgi:hypothetical protein